jgi:purine-binding chemotaxis protein CheW
LNHTDLEVNRQQYLTFLLRDECFGISIDTVREIIEYAQLTTVPLMPDFVKGVINLRGDIVPVIDLSIRLGRNALELKNRTCIIILEIPFEGQRVVIGAAVDSVNEVLEIGKEQVEPPPSFGARLKAQFIQGVVNVEQSFVVLLHGDKVLSIEELASLIENVKPEKGRGENV